MSVEASRYYRAFLGQLDESTQRIFEAWADSQLRRHVLVKTEDGAVVLYAEREEERQKKSHMQTLRTTIQNWKIPVQLPAGFLRLLSKEDFRAALASLPSQPPIAEPAPPCCRVQIIAPEISADFDRRAEEMLAQLVAGGAR